MMFSRRCFLNTAALGITRLAAAGHIPRMQAVPLPGDQVSFQCDEKEIARYYYAPTLNRPFIYPVIGPSGRTLTRMGHPGDPYTHSHHNSIWISCTRVNGVDFWSDRGAATGRIITTEIVDLDDSDERTGIVSKAAWTSGAGKVLLREQRESWVYPLAGGEWVLILDLLLDPASEDVTIGRGGFGPIGVRVAKWLSVHFGDGRIRNSSGAEGEKAIFRKPARWVDYSGSIARGILEGLTLFDHPSNPCHPCPFHVRDDGWMGATLSEDRDTVITRGKPLHLRYGVFVHAGMSDGAALERRWQEFAKLDLHPPFGPPKTERDCLHGGHRKINVPHSFATAKQCLDFVAGK